MLLSHSLYRFHLTSPTVEVKILTKKATHPKREFRFAKLVSTQNLLQAYYKLLPFGGISPSFLSECALQDRRISTSQALDLEGIAWTAEESEDS